MLKDRSYFFLFFTNFVLLTAFLLFPYYFPTIILLPCLAFSLIVLSLSHLPSGGSAQNFRITPAPLEIPGPFFPLSPPPAQVLLFVAGLSPQGPQIVNASIPFPRKMKSTNSLLRPLWRNPGHGGRTSGGGGPETFARPAGGWAALNGGGACLVWVRGWVGDVLSRKIIYF